MVAIHMVGMGMVGMGMVVYLDYMGVIVLLYFGKEHIEMVKKNQGIEYNTNDNSFSDSDSNWDIAG